MTSDTWDRAWAAVQSLPGRGAKFVRVTRVKDREFTAVATVATTTGAGSDEVRCAIGPDADAALEALALLCRAP